MDELTVTPPGLDVFVDAEIDRTIPCPIGDPVIQESAYQFDNFGDVFRRMRQQIRSSTTQRSKILKKSLFITHRVFGEGSRRLLDGGDDLILDIGNIHHVPDGISPELQVSPEHVRKNESSKIAD